jgi:diguanylate cyclase (GGDEF)-like protein
MRNLLELKYSETSALLMGVLIFELLSYIAWGLYNVSDPINQHFVNADEVWQVFWIYMGALTVAVSWLCLCVRHRKNERLQLPLSMGAVSIFLITMVFSGYVSGLLAMSLGVVLAGAPMIGILMLPPRVVLAAVLSGGVFLGGLTYASVAGYLRYAPLFNEQLINTSPDYGIFYFWSQVYFVIPFLIMILAVAHQFLLQWREREAHIHHMSQTDALTELYNRRTAHELLTSLLGQEDEHPVSAILLDLDHFKLINDQHGHLIGDRALKMAAQSLKSSLRTDDLIARFGGEEFLVILNGVTCHTARSVAERCRRILSQASVVNDMGERVVVTGSFGVACMLSGPSAKVDDLLRQADEALYQAKTDGRNRVVNHTCMLETQQLTHPSARRAHRVTRAGAEAMPAVLPPKAR